MSRTQTITAGGLLAVLVAAVGFSPAAGQPAFQPPRPGQPPPFKPFGGVTEGQFFQSSVGRWASQLGLELDSLKAEVNAARLPPGTKTAIGREVDAAAQAAAELERLTRRTGDRRQLDRAYDTVEGALARLEQVAGANGIGLPAVSQALARVNYANQQLAATLAGGGGNGDADRTTAAITRLAHSLDEQGEELRNLVEDNLPSDRNLDQSIRTFYRSARKLHRTVDDTGSVEKARKDYEPVAAAWNEVGARLLRVDPLPDTIRLQAARVGGLNRKLGDLLMAGGGWQPPQPPLPALPPVGGPPVNPPVNSPGGNPLYPPGGGDWGFNPRQTPVFAAGAGDGGGPRVRVYQDLKGTAAFDFFAYDPAFRGGVRVAVADLNGDGIPDLVTAPGRGMPPLVRVFDGRDMSLLVEFNALDGKWDGGLNVAAADMTQRNKRALVAVGPDVGGGPHVHVYDLTEGRLVDQYQAFDPNLRGGVRLAYGDINGDGIPDLCAVQGPCDHNPTLRVFDGRNRTILSEFNVMDGRWRGGVWVAAADITGNGRAEVIAGADAGGDPVVRVYDPVRKQMLAEFEPFPRPFRGGVRVAAQDIDRDGTLDVICAAGGGARNSPVVVFSLKTQRGIGQLTPFAGFDGGTFVGAR